MRFLILGAGGLLCLGAAGVFVLYGLRKLAQRYPDDALVLHAPRVRFRGFDPALRERTASRRHAADKMRTRAAHVETGAQVSDVLKLVRK